MSEPTDLSPTSWHDYEARVAEILTPLAEGDGRSESELADAEARLGLRLPKGLRDYYRQAGRRDDLNRVHDQLIPLDELAVESGALIFFEEHENLRLWGIPVSEFDRDDPPVVRAENEETLVWVPNHDRLSSFFLTMLYWQAVHGGMPFSGWAEIDETELPELQSQWPKVELRGTLGDQLIVFHRPGQVVCVAGRAPNLTLHAAGRTRDDFRSVVAHLKLWEYFPTDDEGPSPSSH